MAVLAAKDNASRLEACFGDKPVLSWGSNVLLAWNPVAPSSDILRCRPGNADVVGCFANNDQDHHHHRWSYLNLKYVDLKELNRQGNRY